MLTEVIVIPLSAAVRISMLFSSIFDVDSMTVPFFASMTLPCFSCDLSMSSCSGLMGYCQLFGFWPSFVFRLGFKVFGRIRK